MTTSHTIPYAEITSLQFGLMTDRATEKLADIDLDRIHPKKNTAIPKTMNCSTLGTTSSTTLCLRCGSDIESCTGHCGKCRLFQPTFKVSFAHVNLKILSSICIRCSRLLLPDNHPKRSRLLRLGATTSYKRCVNEIFKLTFRNRTCWFPIDETEMEETPRCLSDQEAKERGYCGMRQPDLWMRYDNIIVRPAWYIDTKEDFEDLPVTTPIHLQRVLRNVSATTTRMTGFDPEHSPLEALMESVMVVPPLLIRLSRNMHGKEDDLTTTLRLIQTYNAQARLDVVPNLTLGLLRDEKATEPMTIAVAKKKLIHVQGPMSTTHTRSKQPVVPVCLEDYYMLQRAVASLTDAKYDKKLDAEYGREPYCLKKRFVASKRSRGRMRQNCLGKPTKQTIRGVSSCRTDMEIYQIAVPKQALMHCTFPVVVTELNFNDMLQTVLNGKTKYPGCNYVERDGQLLLPDANLGGLKVGDIVHMHWHKKPAIGNRQPSLHRFAIMGYEVILSEGNTIQGHLGCCTVLNEDFDGDEKNIYLPQDLMVLAEATYLMNVRHNLMKDGCLVIGFVQHAVIGAFKLTDERLGKLHLSRSEIQRYIGIGWTPECLRHVMNRWEAKNGCGDLTGREFMNVLLPTYDPVKHTEPLTQPTLNRFMAETIESMQDMNYAADRIGFLTRILEAICTDCAVSIHLGDCYVPNVDDDIELLAHKIYSDACTLSCSKQNARDEYEKYDIENDVCHLADKFRDVKGKYALRVFQMAQRACGMYDIISSKAKGTVANLTQNVIVVGQQKNEDNIRYQDTTSHYYRDDLARYGFIQHSFFDGPTPTEFFFHLRGARNGLVRMYCGTSFSGYTYRQLLKGVEAVRISYRNTVCNDIGDILLFHYGFDPTFAREVKLESVVLNITDTVHRFATDGDSCSLEEVEHLLDLRARAIEYDPKLLVPVPVNFAKRFDCAAKNCAHRAISLNAARNRVVKIWMQLVVQEHIPNDSGIELLFFEQMSTRFLLDRGVLQCTHVFEAYLDFVQTALGSNVAPAGDPVGAKGAQDPMQQITQTNLKLPHAAGEKTAIVDSMTRVKEILNMRSNLQQPIMYMHLLPEYEKTFQPTSILEVRLIDVVTKSLDRPYKATEEEHWIHATKQLSEKRTMHMLNKIEDFKHTHNSLYEPVFLTFFLNQPLLQHREISPRILAHYVQSVALQDVDRDMAIVTYAEVKEAEWWITITLIRSFCGPLIKTFAKDYKSLCEQLPLPVLYLHLHHNFIYGRQLLAGVDGIRNFVPTKRTLLLPNEDQDDRLELKEMPCYLLMGSNVQGICSLPEVDVTYTTSNNIHQIFAEFGISAAQKAIEDNLVEAIQSADKHVAMQHIKVIAAAMCQCGCPAPLSFAGMTSQETATWFKRATFERCLDSFFGAGIQALEDGLRGVSEAVVVGSLISLGTGGDFSLIADEQKMRNEGFITEARSRMQYTVPDIADFLKYGPSQGLTDESVRLYYDHRPKEDPNESSLLLRRANAQNRKRRRKNGDDITDSNRVTPQTPIGDPPLLLLPPPALPQLLYDPLLCVPPLSPTVKSDENDDGPLELCYGPLASLVPPSPKARKKNESRKGNKRRYGDRNLSAEGLRHLEDLFGEMQDEDVVAANQRGGKKKDRKKKAKS